MKKRIYPGGADEDMFDTWNNGSKGHWPNKKRSTVLVLVCLGDSKQWCDLLHVTPFWTCFMNCVPIVQLCGLHTHSALRSQRNPTCPHAHGMLCERFVKHTFGVRIHVVLWRLRTNIGWFDLMRDTPSVQRRFVCGVGYNTTHTHTQPSRIASWQQFNILHYLSLSHLQFVCD